MGRHKKIWTGAVSTMIIAGFVMASYGGELSDGFLTEETESGSVLSDEGISGELSEETDPDISEDLVFDDSAFPENELIDVMNESEEKAAEIIEETEEQTDVFLMDDVVEETEALFDEEFADSGDLSVSDYTYEVRPILAPFNNLFYVRTENPDPYSFRFYDAETSLQRNTERSGICCILDELFEDVVYENEETYRVHDGYIFYCYSCDTDGGELILQTLDSQGNWINTLTTVECPEVKDSSQYLLDTYTDSSMSYFQKLNAVQAALRSLAMYPKGVYRMTPDSYPALASSPYVEIPLNEHYENYDSSDRDSFVFTLYPFVLDSASYPSEMAAIAKMLDPSCTIGSVSEMHWEISVTLDGETHYYGGAGAGNHNPIFDDQLIYTATFDGTESDVGLSSTLSSLQTIYREYVATANRNIIDSQDQIAGEGFSREIGSGTWIRIAVERLLGFGTSYAYAAYGPGGTPKIVSGAWVDGRYVNRNEKIQLGATFEEFPTASIVVHNQTYTDYYGKQHTNDIVYDYDNITDTWRAPFYYVDRGAYNSAQVENMPDIFILTRDEVEQMDLDINTQKIPEAGKIYDGTAVPGTPFGNTLLEGISLPESMTITAGETIDLSVAYNPEDATETGINWILEDSEVVNVWGVSPVYSIRGYKEGKTKITAVSVDGSYMATCMVTVTKRDVVVSGGKEIEAARSLLAGSKLFTVSLINKEFVDRKTGNYVWGTFALDEPDLILPAGTHEVSWTFTPDENAVYNSLSGTVMVTVVKRTPTIKQAPKGEDVKLDLANPVTLGEIALTGGEASVEGTWEWVDDTIVPGIGFYAYACRFIPDDSDTYQPVETKARVYAREINRLIIVRDGKELTTADDIGVGRKLSEVTIQNLDFVDPQTGVTVYGIFSFDEPDQVLPLGTHEVSWTYTPYNDLYQSVSGTLNVTVIKNTAYLVRIPTVRPVTYDENITLSMIPIEDGRANVEGTFEWKDGTIKPVAGQYNTCTIRFIPYDTENYVGFERDISFWMSQKPIQPGERRTNNNRTRQWTWQNGKESQPMEVYVKKPSVKYSKLKKKKRSIKTSKAFLVIDSAGEVTYQKVGGNKKIKVDANGNITLKKGMKKGSYKIKVKVTAAGDQEYLPGSVTVVLKIRVK